MSFYGYLRNILLALIIIQLIPGIYSMLKDQYGVLTMKSKIRVGKVNIKNTIDNAYEYTKQLKELAEQSNIDAIMLSIDSGGGAAGSSQTLHHDIKNLKSEKNFQKPIIAWVENTCASGAYYVASACDEIIASPSAFVGSVGVFIPQWQLKQFIQQFNLEYDIVKTGDYKTLTNPYTDRTPEERKLLEGLTEDVYAVFTQDITQARSALQDKDTESWANGKLFTGHQAIDLGLIDTTGSTLTAERRVKELTEKDGEIEYITPSKPFNLSDYLEQMAASAGNAIVHGVQRIQT